jgi:FkbM family methyltransferase
MIINALGRVWLWPDQDVECRKVVFDWSSDLKWVYQYCKNFRTVVQAGGNMGVWPWLLAKKFDFVSTFEPDPRLYPLMVANLKGVNNVQCHNTALWEANGFCEIKDVSPSNLGAQYIVPGKDTGMLMTTIDNATLFDEDVDLIYLDIEGAELGALKGGVKTIERCKPTIVVEDKGLSEKFGSKRGDIAKFLEPFGYRQAARVHRDSIFVCD